MNLVVFCTHWVLPVFCTHWVLKLVEIVESVQANLTFKKFLGQQEMKLQTSECSENSDSENTKY